MSRVAIPGTPGGTRLQGSLTVVSDDRMWLPRRLPGLQLWLDAQLSPRTIDTGVSVWGDISGNGNNATQGTGANQPALNTTGGPLSLACLDFDGSNDVLVITNIAQVTNAYVLAVYKDPAVAGGTYEALVNDEASANTPRCYAGFNGANSTTGYWNPDNSTAGTDNANWKIASWHFISGSSIVTREDGAAIATTATAATTLGNWNRIGGYAAAAQMFSGSLFAVLIYSTRPTDFARLERYYARRTGITVA